MQENKNPHIVIIIIVLLILVAIIGYFFVLQGGVSINEPKALLTPPANGEEASYEKIVKRAAKSSSVLTIGVSCTMNPLVLRFKAGDTLTMQNDDTTPHVITFENNNFFSVSPHRSRELNITETFSKGAGIYRYRCSDQSNENVGVMYITE